MGDSWRGGPTRALALVNVVPGTGPVKAKANMTDLLELALADPERAWARAEAVVEDSSDPRLLSIAHQARGIVLRDSGRAGEAVAELRTAIRYAGRVDPERDADVRATYGLALVMAGRTAAGRRQLDRAAASVTGEVQAKVLMRRAFALSLLGEQHAALVDMRTALDGIRRSGNRTWEARTLTVLASIEMALGMASDAQRSCEDARRIFQDLGEHEEALDALAILGDVALYRGDLPRALAVFDEMATAPGRVGYQRADIAVSRSVVYLTAGMPGEAVEVLQRLLDTNSSPPRRRPTSCWRWPRRARPPAMRQGRLPRRPRRAPPSEVRIVAGSSCGLGSTRCGRVSSSVIGAGWPDRPATWRSSSMRSARTRRRSR